MNKFEILNTKFETNSNNSGMFISMLNEKSDKWQIFQGNCLGQLLLHTGDGYTIATLGTFPGFICFNQGMPG